MPSLSTLSSVRVALEGGGGAYLGHLGLVLRVCGWSLWHPIKFLSNPGKKDLETQEEIDVCYYHLVDPLHQSGSPAGLARCRTVSLQILVKLGQSMPLTPQTTAWGSR